MPKANAPPLHLERLADIGYHRPVQFHREIPAPVRQLLAVVLIIVDDVDAAAVAELIVHHRDLAVRAREAEAAEQMRVIDTMVDAGERPFVEHRQALGADTVGNHPYLHAARGCAQQSRADGLTRAVVTEDIGFENHVALRRVDAFDQRGEEFVAGTQQLDVVAAGEAVALPVAAAEQRSPESRETARAADAHRARSSGWPLRRPASRFGNCRIASAFDDEKQREAASS